MTVGWSELDRLVGGLPRSAYDHPAFWKGIRSGWPGFTTTGVKVGVSVTFVRRDAPTAGPQHPVAEPEVGPGPAKAPDVVLVGCVKSKVDHPAQARELYTSALFRKARTYAESSGVPWFILSAKHGLVAPSQVIEPYELHLSSTTRSDRVAWGERVVADLASSLGGIEGKTIEVHAGAAYVEAIRAGITAAAATLFEPLSGLTMGERLAWYPSLRSIGPARPSGATSVGPNELASRLRDLEAAVTPDELLGRGRSGLDCPGLYSWWVDDEGAEDLARGLGRPLAPGLIYAGLAGATRSRSRRRSTNTLWGRLQGMHLGTRSDFSTFRRSLGSILAEVRGTSGIDEVHLSSWMHEHLRVVAVPVDDADGLDGLESDVLAELDPPLNLAKMPKNGTRQRLTELRKLHGK
ncbi:MAG: hypothetical protein GY708_23070 [Actinomycetia bacterium]|nr:hypothetical protein [Actinomycetes bacterium]MCP4084646.1 hypothetical protein [Actinomycetes bacterium]